MVGGFNCFCLVVCCFLWIVLQVCWWCGLQSGVVLTGGLVVWLLLYMRISFSKASTVWRCGALFQRRYVDRVPSRGAAWLPQGIAVHAWLEEWERGGRSMGFVESVEYAWGAYWAEVARLAAECGAVESWYGSGPYVPAADVRRRAEFVVEQVKRLFERMPVEELYVTPNGVKGVELPVRFELSSGVEVVGFVDRVINHPKWGVVVQDLKTGRTPADPWQLAVYALGLREQFGVECTRGAIIKADTGRMTRTVQVADLGATAGWLQTCVDLIELGDCTPCGEERCEACGPRDWEVLR